MAGKPKSKKRTGVIKVYDNAEMSARFSKSRKLMKQYKITVYADGRLIKKEIKPGR